MLRKGVYPHEYMDNSKKFNEMSLPDKIQFCSSLEKESITDENFDWARKIFKLKNLDDHYDLYIQRDRFLFSDLFKNIEIYKLDHPDFLLAP